MPSTILAFVARVEAAFVIVVIAVWTSVISLEMLPPVRAVPPVTNTFEPLLDAATRSILVGMFFKLSTVPFHMWLLDVMEGAPVPVAAFLAVVSKIAIFSSLVRYFGTGNQPPFLNDILYVVIILTIMGGNLLALRQTSLTRLLACSSIAHVGYLLIAFLCPGRLQSGAITIYLLAYTASTLGVFATIVAFATPDGPDGTVIAQWKGLFFTRPFLASALSLMLLSLAGIPPGIGFFAKFEIDLASTYGYKNVGASWKKFDALFVSWFYETEPDIEILSSKSSRVGAHSAWPSNMDEGRVFHVPFAASDAEIGEMVLRAFSRCEGPGKSTEPLFP